MARPASAGLMPLRTIPAMLLRLSWPCVSIESPVKSVLECTCWGRLIVAYAPTHRFSLKYSVAWAVMETLRMAKPAMSACYFALGVVSTGGWLLLALLLLWHPPAVTQWFALPLSGFPEPYSHVGPVVLLVLLIPIGPLLGFTSRTMWKQAGVPARKPAWVRDLPMIFLVVGLFMGLIFVNRGTAAITSGSLAVFAAQLTSTIAIGRYGLRRGTAQAERR